jgi:hypothetical protein
LDAFSVSEPASTSLENALAQQGVMRRQEKVVAIRNRRHEVCFDRTGLGMRRLNMATQIVMDQTGDTRHEFDPGNAEALARAERRFRELTGAGFTAALRTGPGEVTRIRSFDPTAQETLFYPRLVGG